MIEILWVCTRALTAYAESVSECDRISKGCVPKKRIQEALGARETKKDTIADQSTIDWSKSRTILASNMQPLFVHMYEMVTNAVDVCLLLIMSRQVIIDPLH